MREMIGKRTLSLQCFIPLSHSLKETMSHLGLNIAMSLKPSCSMFCRKSMSKLFSSVGKKQRKWYMSKVWFTALLIKVEWISLTKFLLPVYWTIHSLPALKRICQAIWAVWPVQSYRKRKKSSKMMKRKCSSNKLFPSKIYILMIF